jgi:sugar lactone lactonase YvrE
VPRTLLLSFAFVVVAAVAATAAVIVDRQIEETPATVVTFDAGATVSDLQCGVASNLAMETEADITQPGPVVDQPGESYTTVASKLPGKPSSIAFHPDDGTLYAVLRNNEAYPRPFAAALNGRIVQIVDGQPHVLLEGLHDPSAILFVGDDLYVSELRQIIRVADVKGTQCGSIQVVLDGLPFDDTHQTNGMVFRDGRIYVSQGNPRFALPSAPHIDLAGTVFSMNLDGSDVQIISRGLRNSFDLAFDDSGQLWAADNGTNTDYDAGVLTEDQTSPDRVLRIEQGRDYGYPCPPGQTCGDQPAALLAKHAAPSGLVWHDGKLIMALWGFWQLATYDPATGETTPFMYELKSPTDVAIGPDGRLYVSSWLTNSIVSVDLPN